MQEDQLPTIKAYNKDGNTASQSKQEDTQLVARKDEANAQRTMRINFIATLPYELAYRVLVSLDQQSKVTCLYVSRVWREILLKHSHIWAAVAIEDGPSDGYIICEVLSFIAEHVESMDLTAGSKCIISRCLFKMRKHRFSRLKSLRLTEASTKFFDGSLSTSLTRTLMDIGTTLTTLSLVHQENIISVTVADALVTCINLQKLCYLAQTFPLSDILGDLSILHAHRFLKDLKLKTLSIFAETIEPLLLKCPNVRRLVLDGCSNPVSDAIAKCCPDLEILGCNSFFSVPKWEGHQDENHLPGLRAVYSDLGTQAIPEQNVLPLLKRNMNTLESIIGIGLGEASEQKAESYEELELTNLKRLLYWSSATDNFIEQIVLRSISKCTALHRFEALRTSHISMAIDVLKTLPPVKILSFSDTYEGEDDLVCTRLIQLFEKYAAISSESELKSLEVICLQSCKSVTDDVLFALAKVKTLYDITICDLTNITVAGISRFIRNLGDSVSTIRLSNLAYVTDHHLEILADVPNIASVSLQGLESITDDGVVIMIDRADDLSELFIEGCKRITQTTVTYAEQNVETFAFDKEFDDTVLLLPDED